jgi:xylan 1,4-beta-xylosidase
MLYQNPVMRGFFPDPSVICVNGMYYAVNSTFQYFPAIVISESRDLVNWRIIGHAITDPHALDLNDIKDSHGIWAPDISYAGGRFWIIAPLRLNGDGCKNHTVLRRQLVMHADKPEGPYSKPVCLEMDNIDPSLFTNEDGSRYLVNAPGITITPLNEDCTAFDGDTVQAWAGTGKRAPEGPHLLKKNGWYYAILAEGGTGFDHQISVARSRNIYGPYEPYPNNPILKQRDPDALLQRCGHAKFVKAPDGNWYALYLCARPIGGKYTVLGRETALQRVEWTEDGWPFMGNGLPLETASLPMSGTVQRIETSFLDHFDGSELKKEWQFVRNPSSEWSLSERPGYFRIWTQDGDLYERRAKNTLVHRETETRYTASTLLHFVPRWEGEQAGLTCYYATDAYIKCAKTANGIVLTLGAGGEERQIAASPLNNLQNPVMLQVQVDGFARSFFFREGVGPTNALGVINDCAFLSDEFLQNGAKRHTGTMIGLYANNGGCGSRIPADFDYFEYKAISG